MERYTFPNQRFVCVHRERPTANFLGIKNENWMAAARDLTPHALLLYLYFAANANNYVLAVSPAAIRQAVGMPRSTYHDQFHVLEDKGYLIPTKGNTFDFFEVPRPRTDRNDEKKLEVGQNFEMCTADGCPNEQADHNVLGEDIEINNIQFPDNEINNGELREFLKQYCESAEHTPPKGEKTEEYPPTKAEFTF